MGKLTMIYQNGEVVPVETNKVKLEDMQKLVGGYIETVPYFDTYEGEPCIAFCDEEGKLKGKARNITATDAWYYGLMSRGIPVEPFSDYLVGDILIVQGADLLRKL